MDMLTLRLRWSSIQRLFSCNPLVRAVDRVEAVVMLLVAVGWPGRRTAVGESSEAFAAQFILRRRMPRAGLTDSTLLVVRQRLVADGLRETISLHNLDRDV